MAPYAASIIDDRTCHVLFACLSLLCCEGADSRDVNTQSRRYLNNVPTARQYICRYSSQISADKYSFRVLFADINASVCVKALSDTQSEGKVKDITHIDKWRKTKTEPCAVSFCLLISLLAMCSSAACVYSVWLIIPSNDWFTGTACYLWMYDYRDHDVPADNFHAYILFPPVSLLYYF